MRPNNFDLLRLLAALQVVYCHGCHHLRIEGGVAHPWLSLVINWFPGVPIFFTISGFLISKSWEKSDNWKVYARNRVIRIYPALWVALVLGIVLTASLGFITLKTVTSPKFFAWIVAQTTIGQFYNPPFLRDFGVGALNGSLWTIPVELGFYLLLPLIYVCVVNRVSRPVADVDLSILSLVSFGYWYYLYHDASTASTLTKVQLLTPLPHLHMFLFGVLLQRNFESLKAVLVGKAHFWLAGFCALMFAFRPWAEHEISSAPVAVLGCRVVLSCLVISLAFTWRSLGEHLLRGNDASYGVYLYHMPVANTLIHFGLLGRQFDLASMFAVTIGLAILSWLFVEKPLISLKVDRKTDRPSHETPANPPTADPTVRQAA